MTTLKELGKIVKDVTGRMDFIAQDLTKYKKLQGNPANWEAAYLFDIVDFIQQIKAEIAKINNVYATYTRPDLAQVYAHKDFDNYAKSLKENLAKMEEKYQHYKDFEDLPYYY